jgi:predicted phage terminase large subunit-like protein
VRYWDRAATENADGRGNPDWTSGTKMSMDRKGIFYIEHLSRFQGTPLTVETGIANTASQDGKRCEIGIEQDPGQAGKAEAEYQVRNLRGYIVHAFPVHRDKVTRAKAYSAQVEAGNVKLVRGDWNEAFILEHENFPPPTGKGKDDQVDSSSGAFMMLASKPRGQAASSWPGATPAQNNDWES